MAFKKLSIGIFIVLSVISCAHTVSYYDSLSYKNLTDLKAETKVFLGACQKAIAKGSLALESIERLALSSSKAYEYEKGKNLNDATVYQLTVIEETIYDIKSRYSKNKYENESCSPREEGDAVDLLTGCLTTGYCFAKWRVLETAFDTAISTEPVS